MIRVSLALICFLALASPARANPAAEQLAVDATTAARDGNFKLAAELFAKSYREDPTRNDVFCNIGISYFKAGELPRAHLLLTQCVQRAALDLAFKDNANAVIASIEQQLRAEKHTPVTITVRPDNAVSTIVEFGSESQFVGARTIWLPFGTHHLETKLDGYKLQTSTIETAEQTPKSVEITLEKAPVVVSLPPGPTPKPAPHKSKLPALATSAVTVGAIAVAVVCYGKAHDAAEAGGFAVDQAAADSSRFPDEVSKWNLRFGIFGTVAIVAAGASGYLWYRALRTPSSTIEVTPTAGGAAVSFRGRF